MLATKTCTACEIPKPLDHFHQSEKSRHTQCKICRIAKIYGMSSAELTKMTEEQKGQCGICKSTPTGKRAMRGIGGLSLDHDHKTGNARMLLCTRCNIGLSNFRESIPILKTAIAYLELLYTK